MSTSSTNSATSLYPLGPIAIGQPVMIVAWLPIKAGGKPNVLWVLTYDAGASPSTLVFQIATTFTTNANPITVTTAGLTALQYITAVDSTTGYYTFTTGLPNANISLSGSNVVTGGATATPVKFSQSAFQPWTGSLLTGVQYNMAETKNGSNVGWSFAEGYTGPQNTIKVGVLPTSFFYGCQAKTSNAITLTGDVLVMAYCSISGQLLGNPKGGCTGPKTPATGAWTNVSDCFDGVSYGYCPVGSTCGTNNCKTTCPVDATNSLTQVCQYNPNTDGNATYACQDVVPAGASTGVKIWLIVGIIGGIILFIILIFIFKSIFHKKNKDDGLDMGKDTDSLVDGILT